MVHDPAALPPELIAIAFVIENTTTVSNDWVLALRDYVTPTLRRLMTAYNIPLRMALVTYGASDSLASPISCKRFFIERDQMTVALRCHAESLGIGSTSTSLNKGLASLEALVAAVELFDDLDQSLSTDPADNPPRPPRKVVKHLIHLAAGVPDGATIPSYNNDPSLDDVSWDTLPAELKKRSINYDAILLRPQGPDSRYWKLHRTLGDSTEPWFPLKPGHTFLLSKYPDQPKAPQGKATPPYTPQQLQQIQQLKAKQQLQQAAQARAQQQQAAAVAAQQQGQQPQPPSRVQPAVAPAPSQVQTPSSKRPIESTESGVEPSKRPRLTDASQSAQGTSTNSPAPSAGGVSTAASTLSIVPKPSGPATPQMQARTPQMPPQPPPQPPQPIQGQPMPQPAQQQHPPPQLPQLPNPPNISALPPDARERFRTPEAQRRIQQYLVTETFLTKRLYDTAMELKNAGKNAEAHEKMQQAQQARMKAEGWKKVMEFAGFSLNTTFVQQATAALVQQFSSRPSMSNPAQQGQPQQGGAQQQGPTQSQGLGQNGDPPLPAGAAMNPGVLQNAGEQPPVNRLASPFKPTPPSVAPAMGQRVLSQSPAQSGPPNSSPYLAQQGFMGGPNQPVPGAAGGPASGGAPPNMPPNQTQDPQIQHQLAKLLDQKRNRPLSQPGNNPMAGTNQLGPSGPPQPQQPPRFPIQNNMNLSMTPGGGAGMGMVGQGQGQGPTNTQMAMVQLQMAVRHGMLQAEPELLPQANPQMPQQTVQPVPVWVGGMKWSGSGQDGIKKEVSCRIQVLSKNPGLCRAGTWPESFQLLPTRQLNVSQQDLLMWIQKYKPAMAYVLYLGEVHRAAYSTFVGLLTDKNVYATAAWTTPSGNQTANVLFFMLNGMLTGAFFPLTGIPDMPKPMGAATAPVTEQRKFAMTPGMFNPMLGGQNMSGVGLTGGSGPAAMTGPSGQQLVPLLDVLAKFPQFANVIRARFPMGRALPEQKAKLIDDLVRVQMMNNVQKAAAASWDPSGAMGGNPGGAGMPSMGQSPGMTNMGNNQAAMQSMASMAAMGMTMGGMSGMNNGGNGSAGGAGAQGFNFMSAGMNMGFGQGGS